MIEVDGSIGEGGGQIVRSSLALSIITGKPFQIHQVRANRQKPGLLNQHLTAVNAAAAISEAKTSGVKLGSSAFTFTPGPVKSGNYRFNIGTAGSTMLVFQTILPPLMLARGQSAILLEGGTHNPMAPPFEFIKNTFLPLLERMGVTVKANLEAYGFYPQGGGSLRFDIEPTESLIPLHITEKGEINFVSANAVVVKLPVDIANRELRVLKKELFRLDGNKVIEVQKGRSPGNVIIIEIQSEALLETVTSIAERSVKAEQVAHLAAEETNNYLASAAAVGEHLADQLLIPMALAGTGSFLTSVLSAHTLTNIDVIQKFLSSVSITTDRIAPNLFEVRFAPNRESSGT